MSGEWRQLVIDSLVRPRRAARDVLGLGVPQNVILMAAIAVTCLGLVLGWAAMMMSPGGIDGVSAAILGNPLPSAAAEFGGMLLIAFLTSRIGRALSGGGGFWDALTLIVWLNAVMILIQLAQLVLLVVAPPVAGMLAVATVLWVLWAFASFVTELHGFQNPFLVLGGVVLAGIVLFFALAVLLSLAGLTPRGTV